MILIVFIIGYIGVLVFPWIGLKYFMNSWGWRDGESPYDYKNWASGEPSPSERGKYKDCTFVSRK